MTNRRVRALLLACSGAGALLATTVAANAGGFAVREQSPYGQGTSFAGIAAGGDLTGMFWNPAVMTQFAGIQSSSSYSGIFPYASHTAAATSTWANPLLGGLGGAPNSGTAALVPGSTFSYQVNQSLWLGLSFNSPFGLSVAFPQVWAGRDYATNDTSLTTFNATPSIAYRINDWISVGAGVQIEYGKAQLNHNVTVPTGVSFPPIVALGDGNLGGTGWGYGFTAGVTLTPTSTTTVGLGYRSAINQKISGTLALPPALGGNFAASTTLNLPGMVSLGIRQRIDPQWTLLGTVEWTNWSRIGTSVISASLPPGIPTQTLPFQYKDGWLFSVGAEYQASDRLTLRTGFGYEISPISDSVRTPVIPDNDRFWASVGASYQIWQGLTANLAYSHLFVRSTPINISAASGNPWFNGITYVGDVQAHVDILSIGLKFRWDELTGPVTSKLITK
jgi:long-chain fatty acid transport protein